jgi:triacylglycerol lipase
MENHMITDMSFLDKSYMFAILAGAAYKDDSSVEFNQYNLTNYVFFDKLGAQGHAACNDTDIVITCRGTQPDQINDLAADADAIPKRHANGWVHEGFRREARKLLPMILNYIRAYPKRNVWLTGHSLGAAMALYITQELEFEGLNPSMLFTYGCPRLGNRSYVESVKTEHHRYVNCNDVVPTVPPFLMGYRHHGNLHYINFYGNIRNLTLWQNIKDKIRAHLNAITKFEVFEGIDDHSVSLYAERIKCLKQ